MSGRNLLPIFLGQVKKNKGLGEFIALYTEREG